MTDPRARVNAAFAAYRAARGQPVAVQDAARRRYDAAVAEHEAMTRHDGIRGARDRMGLASNRPTAMPRRSAWEPDPK